MRSTPKSRPRARLAIAACVGLLACAVAPPARADQIAVAADLFQQAKQLMTDGNIAEACKFFGQSMKLDPGTGTLLNLAVCHEKEGKIASAWAEFSQVIPMARNQSRGDRVQLAQERVDALAPRLSRITLVVSKESSIRGLSIRVDGSEIDDLLWNKGLTQDPGNHVVEATAKGKLPWSGEVTIAGDAEQKSVIIPVLEDAPVVAAPPQGAPRSDVDTLAAADALAAARARRILGFSLGGVGIASVGVGIVFGALAIAANRSARDACPEYPAPCATADAKTAASARNSDAVTRATISNVGIGFGLIAIAGGAVLVFTANPGKSKPPDPARAASLRIAPAPIPGGGALLLGGGF